MSFSFSTWQNGLLLFQLGKNSINFLIKVCPCGLTEIDNSIAIQNRSQMIKREKYCRNKMDKRASLLTIVINQK